MDGRDQSFRTTYDSYMSVIDRADSLLNQTANSSSQVAGVSFASSSSAGDKTLNAMLPSSDFLFRAEALDGPFSRSVESVEMRRGHSSHMQAGGLTTSKVVDGSESRSASYPADCLRSSFTQPPPPQRQTPSHHFDQAMEVKTSTPFDPVVAPPMAYLPDATSSPRVVAPQRSTTQHDVYSQYPSHRLPERSDSRQPAVHFGPPSSITYYGDQPFASGVPPTSRQPATPQHHRQPRFDVVPPPEATRGVGRFEPLPHHSYPTMGRQQHVPPYTFQTEASPFASPAEEKDPEEIQLEEKAVKWFSQFSFSPSFAEKPRHPKDPTNFDGETMDWTEYWAHFMEVTCQNQWNYREMASKLFTSLRGKALTTANTLSIASRRNIAILAYALECRFNPQGRQRLHTWALMGATRDGDDAVEFASRLKHLSQKATAGPKKEKISENFLIQRYMLGLDDKTCEHVALGRATTLDDAALLADEFEILQKIRRKGKPAVREAEASEPTQEEPASCAKSSVADPQMTSLLKTIQDLTKQVSELKSSVSDLKQKGQQGNTSKPSKDQRECFYCRKKGHLIKDCYAKKKKEERDAKKNKDEKKEEAHEDSLN